MSTLTEYEQGTFWDTKGNLLIKSITGSLLLGTKTQIKVQGYGFDESVRAILYTNRENPDIREIVSPTSVDPFEVVYEFTPSKTGELNLLLSNGVNRSQPQKILSRDLSTVSQNLDGQGWLTLNNSGNLTISTTEKVRNTLVDVRHFVDSVPVVDSNGIFIDRKGYLAFPVLAWDKTKESRVTSFVWFNAGDQQPFFCLAGEPFNYDRNDYYDVELGCRIYRNRGIYAAVGRLSKGGNCYAFERYEYPESNRFYRLDIGSNGDRGEKFKLYLLESGDPQHWEGGILVNRQDVPLPLVREGRVLTPMLANFNGSRNPILAVRSI